MKGSQMLYYLIVDMTFTCLIILQFCSRYLRGVAYRWLARWMYGYLGWDNTRVLPACIYNYIRTKYPSQQQKGYAASNERT